MAADKVSARGWTVSDGKEGKGQLETIDFAVVGSVLDLPYSGTRSWDAWFLSLTPSAWDVEATFDIECTYCDSTYCETVNECASPPCAWGFSWAPFHISAFGEDLSSSSLVVDGGVTEDPDTHTWHVELNRL
jgi:hypothetical protein